MTNQQIDNTFTYHAPFGDQVERYASLREHARLFAVRIQNSCPESHEKSLAFTTLQEVMMWANAAIAINETPPPKPDLAVGFPPGTDLTTSAPAPVPGTIL